MNINEVDQADTPGSRSNFMQPASGSDAALDRRASMSVSHTEKAPRIPKLFSQILYQARSRRTTFYFVIIILMLAVAIVIGIAVGSTHITPGVVMRVLASHVLPAGWVDVSGVRESEQVVIWLIRAPRVLVASLVGAALAIAGAQMQGLFKNPLASPDVVGTSSGGAFGAVFALATGLAARSLFYIPVFSFVGALAALFVVYAIATQRGRTPVASLLLAGIALNAMIGAATTFLITMTWVRYEVAQEIIFWLLGGLDSRTWEHVWFAGPFVAIGVVLSLIYARDLDLLLMGEEAASSLGVEVEQVKRIMLTSAALLTGAAVAISGVLGFVGLVVPHIVRLLIGPSHRRLIPASALTGAVFLIFADLLARTLHRPEEIRLGIITAVFGAPFFLYLLVSRRREIGYL
ncbi:MAG TPA: iron chelate uptake ABC transporter family permease subunit [Blastocatellia bacterium]|jgi:iron complex transport system permease protein